MWKQFSKWYSDFEDETLRVLAYPETAAQVAGTLRRRSFTRLAGLTPIERQQMHAFVQKYRGITFYWVILKLIVLCSIIGLVLHSLFPDKLRLVAALTVSNLAGLAIAWSILGVWFNYRKLAHKKFKVLALFLLSPAATGMALGIMRTVLIEGGSFSAGLLSGGRIGAIAALTAGLVYLVPMSIVAIWRNREYEALTLKLERDAERERMARELSESQLRLLRAQIEPHFLFNTLGAVQQLAEQGAPKAAALTADLIAFLRTSLDKMRREQVPLQGEFNMVAAYLRVMQARMGQRLRFQLDLPAELADTLIPSMIVLTLAENAIKHGIEPALRGGDIHVSAQLVGSMLRLRVRDTGMGLRQVDVSAAGGGLGLDNIRSRLQLAAQHGGGPAGSLEVRNGEESGVIADILLSYKTMTEETA